MSTRYRSIFPMSQKDAYYANDNVDFILSLSQEALLSGSVTLEGKVKVWMNSARSTPMAQADLVYYDHIVGAHGLIRDITTEFRAVGVVENYLYPRYVKHEMVATVAPESLGTETNHSVELRVCSDSAAQGMLLGMTTADRHQPFSLKLRNCVNKATAPLPSSQTGDIRIRLRLSPNAEWLYGPDYVEGSVNYEITELKMRFTTIPDDGKAKAVSMEVLQLYKASIDSNNANVSTFVPGECRGVSISFIKQQDENTAGTNYLLMSVPPGIPPYQPAGTTPLNLDHYGVERLYYSVNDTDTALIGFTLESREELILNGLRVFNQSPVKYNALIRRFNDPERPDCYLIGVPFGGMIDFSRNKFSMEVQSQISSGVANAYNVYVYFPTMVSL